MTTPRTLLAVAALAAAATAAPANAAEPNVGQDLVYTVSASHEGGGLDATCTFRPDRWTADYGPTQIDGAAVTTMVGSHVTLNCRIYSWDSLAGEASASSQTNVATIVNDRNGVVGSRPHIKVCVSASVASTVIDAGYSIGRCVYP